MLSRRRLLSQSIRMAALMQIPGLTWAYHDGDARLVVFVLRGGLDGLAAVPPYGEPRYEALREELAISRPNGSDGSRKLDGTFALHPALETLHALYGAGELAVVHAVATPYRQRSHFDGQDVLENGGSRAAQSRDGWLNRTIAALPGQGQAYAMALAQNIPLILRGDAPVRSWAPSRLPRGDADDLERIAELYAPDALLSARLRDALAARELAAELASATRADMNRDRAPARDADQRRAAMDGDARRARDRAPAGMLAAAAGRFLSADDGPRIAVLESRGWDTHANQGAEQGTLANRLARLDDSVAALRRELGETWSKTAVLAVTEFGRTAAVNGTRGTDHGMGSCMFVAGGAVRGGRVIADWPGLAERDLYESRDLEPTTDMRSILKAVLRDHLGIAEKQLDTIVFPESKQVNALEGLIAV